MIPNNAIYLIGQRASASGIGAGGCGTKGPSRHLSGNRDALHFERSNNEGGEHQILPVGIADQWLRSDENAGMKGTLLRKHHDGFRPTREHSVILVHTEGKCRYGICTE